MAGRRDEPALFGREAVPLPLSLPPVAVNEDVPALRPDERRRDAREKNRGSAVVPDRSSLSCDSAFVLVERYADLKRARYIPVSCPFPSPDIRRANADDKRDFRFILHKFRISSHISVYLHYIILCINIITQTAVFVKQIVNVNNIGEKRTAAPKRGSPSVHHGLFLKIREEVEYLLIILHRRL